MGARLGLAAGSGLTIGLGSGSRDGEGSGLGFGLGPISFLEETSLPPGTSLQQPEKMEAKERTINNTFNSYFINAQILQTAIAGIFQNPSKLH